MSRRVARLFVSFLLDIAALAAVLAAIYFNVHA